jgi:hypothetical protein
MKMLVDDARWISYYHTFPFEKNVQELIRNRLIGHEIIFVGGQYEKASDDDILPTSDHRETNAFKGNVALELFVNHKAASSFSRRASTTNR